MRQRPKLHKLTVHKYGWDLGYLDECCICEVVIYQDHQRNCASCQSWQCAKCVTRNRQCLRCTEEESGGP